MGKYIKFFENFIMNEASYKTSEEICDYIREITPYEDDVPDFFLNMITTANVNFELKRLNIQDVISNDIDVEDYIKYSEDRYKDSDFDEFDQNIDNPIVIYNNIVIDGYIRLLVKSLDNESEIDAWVSI